MSGRGLLLVDRLADIWGVESQGTGNTVWSEFICQDGPDRSGEGEPGGPGAA
ncbi:ATP-binding protein [Streptomyces sp. NPDC004647]|uniref:ATP-binding protein n=1 Tax=Streptomyces sp. NPDC004647 TaxID=3154671 RepID=UPI0033B6C026